MSNFSAPPTIEEIVLSAEKDLLYLKLIEQLNKDFLFANEPLNLERNTSAAELKRQLHQTIYKLIENKYAELLNLLYIIDVPEENVKQLDGSNLKDLADQIAYLVLRREWMKVWFRNRF